MYKHVMGTSYRRFSGVRRDVFLNGVRLNVFIRFFKPLHLSGLLYSSAYWKRFLVMDLKMKIIPYTHLPVKCQSILIYISVSNNEKRNSITSEWSIIDYTHRQCLHWVNCCCLSLSSLIMTTWGTIIWDPHQHGRRWYLFYPLLASFCLPLVSTAKISFYRFNL